MDFYDLESRDAIRFSWNVFPPNKVSLFRAHVPLGCLYTPMKDIETLIQLEYRPQLCQKCQSVLNPYARVDFKGKIWYCPICSNGNKFPKEYADNISETTLPPELIQDYSTIEYVLPSVPNQNTPPSIYLFVIDTCLPKEELQAIKDSIL
jgi:protein transport protein SEC23